MDLEGETPEVITMDEAIDDDTYAELERIIKEHDSDPPILDADRYLQDQFIQYQAKRIDVLEKELENQRLHDQIIVKSMREVMVLMVATLSLTALTMIHTAGLL